MDQHFPTFQQVYDERYQFWHPHIHTLVTCGAFTPEGDFLEVHELDMDRLHAAWREAVFALYLAEDKIEREVIENMRTWTHSGFSADQSVFLPAGDLAGIQRLMQYMTRCPFSLSRLIKVTESGQVVYKAVIEKILRHCGLWHPSTPLAPPTGIGWVHAPDDELGELTYVDIDIFEATF